LLKPDDPDFWKSVRNQFPLDKDTVFFNPGTIGAMPKVVVEKMTEHLKYVASSPANWAYKDDNKEEFISGYNNLMSIRTKVGKLINASALEIAMTDNVIRTYFIGKSDEMPLFFMFLGLIGGAAVYGAAGLLIGPLVVAIMPVFIDIYKEMYLHQDHE